MNPSARVLALEQYLGGRSSKDDTDNNPRSVIGGVMMMNRLIVNKLDKVTADPNWSTRDGPDTVFKFSDSFENISLLH